MADGLRAELITRDFNRMLEDGLIEKAPGKRITASKPATVYRFLRKSAPA